MQIDTSKHFLEPQEAADILSCSASTVRRMFDTGVLRGYRLPGGKHRRIETASVFDYCNPRPPAEQPQTEATP